MFSLFFELAPNFCICLEIGVNSSMATTLITYINPSLGKHVVFARLPLDQCWARVADNDLPLSQHAGGGGGGGTPIVGSTGDVPLDRVPL